MITNVLFLILKSLQCLHLLTRYILNLLLRSVQFSFNLFTLSHRVSQSFHRLIDVYENILKISELWLMVKRNFIYSEIHFKNYANFVWTRLQLCIVWIKDFYKKKSFFGSIRNNTKNITKHSFRYILWKIWKIKSQVVFI